MAGKQARLFELPLATQAGRVSAMRDLYRDGDVEQALMVAAVIETTFQASRELTLDHDASEDGTLVHYHSGMRPTSVLGLDCVLRLAKSPDEIAKLPFDHRVGFLLALIDGQTTLDTLLDLSAMPADEAMSLLHELLILGVVQVT